MGLVDAKLMKLSLRSVCVIGLDKVEISYPELFHSICHLLKSLDTVVKCNNGK